MLFDGVPITTVSKALQQEVLTGMIRPGQSFETTVQQSGGRLFISLGDHKIPLDAELPFTAGQAVRAEIIETAPELRLRILPRTDTGARGAASAGATATAASSLEPVLRQVLDLLGAPALRGLETRFIPRELPPDASALRQLFTVILGRSGFGADLEELTVLLQAAAEDSIVTPEIPGSVQQLMLANAGDSVAIARFLKNLSGGQALEARIAEALRNGQPDLARRLLQEDLVARVAQLRGRDALIAYFRGRGQLQRFEEVIQRITDHGIGSRIMNIHGSDQPWHFLEIPFAPETGMQQARIYFFEEEQGSRKNRKKPFSIAAFDLETTRLGAIWITLKTAGNRIDCRFRVMHDEIVNTIEENADSLRAALEDAGYAGAVIRASRWDGDRLAEAARIMRRFSRINVNA
jgi:hypothetical protein